MHTIMIMIRHAKKKHAFVKVMTILTRTKVDLNLFYLSKTQFDPQMIICKILPLTVAFSYTRIVLSIKPGSQC